MIVSYNNKIIGYNSKWVNYITADPYNPLNLPPYTIRLLYRTGITPTFEKGTGVQISRNPNIWDLTYNNTEWSSLLMNHFHLLEVLGANTSGVTNMQEMFLYCESLTTVALFDTSNVTNMIYMFNNCLSLTTSPLFDTSNVTDMTRMFFECYALNSVPLFDTSNVTSMEWMFLGCPLTSIPLFDTSKVTNVSATFAYCYKVQSGALALYNQMISQAEPPTIHWDTFESCGRDTVTGAAELAQIPDDWK